MAVAKKKAAKKKAVAKPIPPSRNDDRPRVEPFINKTERNIFTSLGRARPGDTVFLPFQEGDDHPGLEHA